MFLKFFSRKFVRRTFIAVVCLLFLQLILASIAGAALQSVFASGTGCGVVLHRPWVSLLKMRGSVSNISIRCRGEQDDEGFKAGKLEIDLVPSALFSKRLVFSELRIHDTQLVSLGEETAFVKTMDFLFGGPDEPEDGVSYWAQDHWHSLLTAGWDFDFRKVRILTTPSRHSENARELLIGNDAISFAARSVDFAALLERPGRNPRVRLIINGGSGEVRVADGQFRPVGLFHANGVIESETLKFDKLSIGAAAELKPRQSQMIAEGQITFGADGEYALSVEGDLFDAYAQSLLSPKTPANSRWQTTAKGKISGLLTKPKIEISLQSLVESGCPFQVKFACPFRKASAEIFVLDDLVRVKKISIDDAFYTAAGSQLQGEVEVRDGLLKGRFSEKGFVPSLSIVAQPQGNPQSAPKTAFKTISSAHFDTRIEYDFQKQSVAISNLKISKYPLAKVVSRIAPLLSPEQQAGLGAYLPEGSTLQAAGDFRIDLKEKKSSGKGFVTLRKIKLLSMKEVEFHVPFVFARDGVRFSEIMLQTPAGAVSGSGSLKFDGRLSLKGNVNDFRLSEIKKIQSLDEDLDLRVTGDFSTEGPISKLVSKAKITLTPYTDDTPELDYQSRFEVNGSFHAVKVSATLLNRGVLEYEGDLGAPLLGSGRIKIEPIEIGETSYKLSTSKTLEVRLVDKELLLSNVDLFFADKRLALFGKANVEKGWDVHVQGTLGLDQFLPEVSSLEQLSGLAELNLIVSGPFLEPYLGGEVGIQGGTLVFSSGGALVGIDDIVGKLNVRNNNIEITDLSGRLGSGVLRASGAIENIFSPPLRSMQARLSLDKASFEPLDNASATIDGDLRFVQLSGSQPKLTGKIDIRRALYEGSVSLTELITSLSSWLVGNQRLNKISTIQAEYRDVKGVTSDEQTAVALDIAVKGDNSIIIETNVAQAALRADLLVQGTSRFPTLDGELRVLDGNFGLKGSRFDVISGTLGFTPELGEIDPTINLIAETNKRGLDGLDHRIKLLLSGKVREPRVNFSSDSGLPEEQIVALFGIGGDVTGVPILNSPSTDISFRDLISPTSDIALRDRIAGLTGFSEVELATDLADTTGEFVPRVLARRPLTQELKLTLQSQLTQEQVSEFDLDYSLTPFFRIFAGWTNTSVTNDVNESSGSFRVGVHYKRSFPGALFWRSQPLKDGPND